MYFIYLYINDYKYKKKIIISNINFIRFLFFNFNMEPNTVIIHYLFLLLV